MRIERLTADEIDERVRNAWRSLQAAHPLYANPYYSPEFTQLVGRVRPRVYVAVIEEGDDIVGVFPFETDSRGRGRPVGTPLTDYQGLIGSPEIRVDPKQLLKACRLYRWDFDHVPEFQSVFAPHATHWLASPGIRLDDGFEAYVIEKSAGSRLIKQTRSRRRRLGREVGDVRFEAEGDHALLELLMEWKSAQYLRSGTRDRFSFAWVRELLRLILEERSPGLRGILSVLYAADRPVALHMGMRSDKIFHWWFPAHDRSFGKYSPGVILLLDLIEYSASSGVVLVDLGRDESHHKSRFENCEQHLMIGNVHLPSLRYGFDRLGEVLLKTLRKAPVPKLLRTAGRRLHRGLVTARLR